MKRLVNPPDTVQRTFHDEQNIKRGPEYICMRVEPLLDGLTNEPPIERRENVFTANVPVLVVVPVVGALERSGDKTRTRANHIE